MPTIYPTTYKPEAEGRTGIRGFSNPVVWFLPNRQMKLTQDEYDRVSSNDRYQKLKEIGAIIEAEPIEIADTEETQKTKTNGLTKDNVYDDLLGFSVEKAKGLIAETSDQAQLKKWLEAEEADSKPRKSIVSVLTNKIIPTEND